MCKLILSHHWTVSCYYWSTLSTVTAAFFSLPPQQNGSWDRWAELCAEEGCFSCSSLHPAAALTLSAISEYRMRPARFFHHPCILCLTAEVEHHQHFSDAGGEVVVIPYLYQLTYIHFLHIWIETQVRHKSSGNQFYIHNIYTYICNPYLV